MSLASLVSFAGKEDPFFELTQMKAEPSPTNVDGKNNYWAELHCNDECMFKIVWAIIYIMIS